MLANYSLNDTQVHPTAYLLSRPLTRCFVPQLLQGSISVILLLDVTNLIHPAEKSYEGMSIRKPERA